MGITSERDYILNLIKQLNKVFALLLDKNILESEEDFLEKVNEGLSLLNLSIDEVKAQKMEQIIAEHRDMEVLTLLNKLLNTYLQRYPDEKVLEQQALLSQYLNRTKHDCLFTDFYRKE